MKVLVKAFLFLLVFLLGVPLAPAEQVRITQPVDLLDENGRLQVRGWSPRPLARFNPERLAVDKKRLREWEFFTLLNERYSVNFTLARIGLAGFCSVDFFDFQSKAPTMSIVLHFNPDGKVAMTRTSRGDAVCLQDGKPVMSFHTGPTTRRIVVDMPASSMSAAVKGEIVLHQNPDMDFLALVTPFSDARHFFYEQKIPSMPAEGMLQVGDQKLTFLPSETFAVMDWGRGVWPQRVQWRWGSASGIIDGKPFGFNIGNGFGDTSFASANLLVVNGRGHKLDQVEWVYDPQDFMKPWKFTSNDARFELDFVPFYDQAVDANILIAGAQLHKLYGHFSGWVTLDDGRRMRIEKLIGFAEEMFITW